MFKSKVKTTVFVYFLVSALFISLYTISPAFALTEITLDSNGTANYNTNKTISSVHPSSIALNASANSQSFIPVANYILTGAAFYLLRNATPVGFLKARLYVCLTGVSNDIPNETQVLAESNVSLAMSAVSNAAIELVRFNFSSSYLLSYGTSYCIALVVDNATTLNSANNIFLGADSTPAHAGKRAYFANSVWTYESANDIIFYVYGTEPSDTIDYYNETNVDQNAPINCVHPAGVSTTNVSAYSQSFTVPAGTNKNLTAMAFMLAKSGSPTGYLNASLYSHSGTYGTNSTPNNSLANSTGYSIASLPTYTLLTDYDIITFNFSSGYTLTAGTTYCATVFAFSGNINSTNIASITRDNSTPTHGGNYAFYQNNTWYPSSVSDLIFYVYGTDIAGDTTAPTYTSINKTSTTKNAICNFSCQWTDETDLSGYIFSTNNTGTYTNESWTAFSSNPGWANITKTLNSTAALVVAFKWYANDSSNNWNTTTEQTFTIIESRNLKATFTNQDPPPYKVGQQTTIVVTVTDNATGAAISTYEMNISRDGSPWKQNFSDTTFSDVEYNTQSHTYKATEIWDSDNAAPANSTTNEPTNGIQVDYQTTGGGGGGTGTGGGGGGGGSAAIAQAGEAVIDWIRTVPPLGIAAILASLGVIMLFGVVAESKKKSKKKTPERSFIVKKGRGRK